MLTLLIKIKKRLSKFFEKKRNIDSSDVEFKYQDKKVVWLYPWYAMARRSRDIMQRELKKELSVVHPLYKLNPKVIARSDEADDIFVALDENKFAEIHLTWQGRVDQYPKEFPRYCIYNSITEFHYCRAINTCEPIDRILKFSEAEGNSILNISKSELMDKVIWMNNKLSSHLRNRIQAEVGGVEYSKMKDKPHDPAEFFICKECKIVIVFPLNNAQ